MPKGEWKEVELPSKGAKVEHCTCDNAGTFSLIVTDKGVVYFGGMNKKGEAGEPGKGTCGWLPCRCFVVSSLPFLPSLPLSPPVSGRQAQKPIKLKRMMKLKEQEVVSSACGAHATAMVSKDGKVFMFGNLEEDLTDKSSGELEGVGENPG